MIGEHLLARALLRRRLDLHLTSFWVGSTGRSSRSAEPVKGRPVAREAVGRGNIVCVHSGQRRGCALARESGTGDDSVILTPTRAEISEPPKVESVIPISSAQSTPHSHSAFSTCRSRRALSRAVPRVPGISLLACYQGAASKRLRRTKTMLPRPFLTLRVSPDDDNARRGDLRDRCEHQHRRRGLARGPGRGRGLVRAHGNLGPPSHDYGNSS